MKIKKIYMQTSLRHTENEHNNKFSKRKKKISIIVIIIIKNMLIKIKLRINH